MDARLLARLDEIEAAFDEIEKKLAEGAAVTDQPSYADLARRHSELAPIVDRLHAWRRADRDAAEAMELAGEDSELAAELEDLARERSGQAAEIEAALRTALTPVDPNDHRDVIIEVRAAAGGDEAAIWAGDLVRMYQRYADRHRFGAEMIEASPSEAGGFSRATFALEGSGAYSRLKFEGGVHRVQRVPKTESQGRIHTSTATVAVLPEVDEVELELDPGDVRVDVFRSTGPGGQSVNTTDSAVRLTHVPTGLVVSCQDEKSQLQNKEKAFRVLRARLYQLEQERREAEVSGNRRSQIGTGERSEKIRTYNFRENRVTDHRIGLTVKRLPEVLDGDLDVFIDALASEEQARRLAEGD